MSSLKSPLTTSYVINRHHSYKLLSFEKIAFFLHFGDRQTDGQTNEPMDSIDAQSRSRCRERQLNNSLFLFLTDRRKMAISVVLAVHL